VASLMPRSTALLVSVLDKDWGCMEFTFCAAIYKIFCDFIDRKFVEASKRYRSHYRL